MPCVGVPTCQEGITAFTSHPHQSSVWGWEEIFQTPWVQHSPSLPHCIFLGHYVRQGEFVFVQSRSPDSLKPLRIYHPELLFVGLQDPLPHSRTQMLLCLLHRACCPPGALTPLSLQWMPSRAGFPVTHMPAKATAGGRMLRSQCPGTCLTYWEGDNCGYFWLCSPGLPREVAQCRTSWAASTETPWDPLVTFSLSQNWWQGSLSLPPFSPHIASLLPALLHVS